MNKRNILIGAVVVAGLVAVSWKQIGYQLFVAPLFSSKEVTLQGSFFRTRTEFVVDGKEKMVFDTIVACNTQLSGSRATGTSVLHGIVPNLVAQRTEGGNAVLVVTPKMCSESRRGGWESTRKKFIPVVVWYKDASDLSSGLLYASPYAYENPRSRLKFISALVGPATRKEWEEWRASKDQRPANVVDPTTVRPAVGASREAHAQYQKFIPGRKYFSERCAGYARIKIAEVYRQRFRDIWPSHRPRYWTSKGEDWIKKIKLAISGPGTKDEKRGPGFTLRKDPTLFIGADGKQRSLRAFWRGPQGERSFAIASPDGKYGTSINTESGGFPATEYYPLIRYDGNPFLTLENGQADEYRWQVAMDGGGNDGYLFCQSFIKRKNYFGGKLRRYVKRLDVDGAKVFAIQPTISEIVYFVENDEYLWALSGSEIVSNGGVE